MSLSLPRLEYLLNLGLQQNISSYLYTALYSWYKKFSVFLLKQLRHLHRTYMSVPNARRQLNMEALRKM